MLHWWTLCKHTWQSTKLMDFQRLLPTYEELATCGIISGFTVCTRVFGLISVVKASADYQLRLLHATSNLPAGITPPAPSGHRGPNPPCSGAACYTVEQICQFLKGNLKAAWIAVKSSDGKYCSVGIVDGKLVHPGCEQFNARLCRSGQKNPVVSHVLIAEKTLDRSILRSVQSKTKLQDDLMAYLSGENK